MIHIKADSAISLASGYGWYLEKYLNKSVSFTGNNLSNLPDNLPIIESIIRKNRLFKYSYY